ncbi:MAG: secondary thiamine-phosphate synthase enzyme YjbQ [Spirochaetes bacterium]|nr:secondary thiamine-phosphate synthase enzyme YjbQ [Spirochaetota bacterium]
MKYNKTINIKTSSRDEFINVTGIIRSCIDESGIKDGICHLFNPHTTAGLTINEQADPDVVSDIIRQMDKVFPWNNHYLHGEGNSAAHMKASVFGSSLAILVEQGKPVLGTWQGIFFCEFDGPRSRKLNMKIV